MQAHREDTKVSKIAMQWAATEDDHGGTVIWPDALHAKIGAPKDNRKATIRDVDRMANNAARLAKHYKPDGYEHCEKEVKAALRAIENLRNVIENGKP